MDPPSSRIRTRLASTSNNLSPPSLPTPMPYNIIHSSDYTGLASINGYNAEAQSNTNSDHPLTHSPGPTTFANIPYDPPHGQSDYIHYPPHLSDTVSFQVQHSLYPINPLSLAQDIKQQTDSWSFGTHHGPDPTFATNVGLAYPPYSGSSTHLPDQPHPHQSTTHARASHPPWALPGSLDTTTGIFYRTPAHPRLRTAQACEKCRSRKAKCSGERPTCNRCLTRGLTCGYAKEGRMRGPNKPKNLEKRRPLPLSLSPHIVSTNPESQPLGICGNDGSLTYPRSASATSTSFESSPTSTAPSPLTPGSLASVYEDDSRDVHAGGRLYLDEPSPGPGCASASAPPDAAWAVNLGHEIFGEGQLDFGRTLSIGEKVGWGNPVG